MPRPYPPEFRQRALDLVRSGRSVPEVAKLLGIAESCLYRSTLLTCTGAMTDHASSVTVPSERDRTLVPGFAVRPSVVPFPALVGRLGDTSSA